MNYKYILTSVALLAVVLAPTAMFAKDANTETMKYAEKKEERDLKVNFFSDMRVAEKQMKELVKTKAPAGTLYFCGILKVHNMGQKKKSSGSLDIPSFIWVVTNSHSRGYV